MAFGSGPRHLSPAETAKVCGITVRTLRVYESKGLVRPMRTQAGWRAYGPDALARLHQVLTLKRLGLSLANIAVLISGRLAKLDSVLELQEQVLARRRAECERGLDLIRSARVRLASCGSLCLDDLITLTKETTMNEQAPEWARKMQPMIDKHFTAEDKTAMASRSDTFDQARIGSEWEELIARAKALIGADPGSPEALDVARRWRAQVDLTTGGDPALFAKLGAAWRDALSDPEVGPALPIGPEVWAFVGAAMARLPSNS